MAIRVQWDLSDMRATLNRYAKTTRKTTPVILNQRFSNVVRRAFNFTPPHNVDVKRKQVRAYLRQPLATRIKYFKSGKRKGQFGKKGARNKQLQRVHLILNRLRGKRGLKGLYGHDMLRLSGAFVKQATNAVGFAKSLFIPMMKQLERVVKFRGIRVKRGNIKIWNDPKGFSDVSHAKEGSHPTIRFVVGSRVRKSDANLHKIINNSWRRAMRAEERELKAHLERKAKENAKRTGAA